MENEKAQWTRVIKDIARTSSSPFPMSVVLRTVAYNLKER